MGRVTRQILNQLLSIEMYTYKVNTIVSPSLDDVKNNAIITLICNNPYYVQQGDSITVPKDSIVNVNISCRDNNNIAFLDYNDVVTINNNINIDIEMKYIIPNNLTNNIQIIKTINCIANKNYNIELFGGFGTYRIDGGGGVGGNTVHKLGGKATINYTANINDILEIKAINYYGMGLWLNNTCIMVAGGGGSAAFATGQMVSAIGGGGYEGGIATGAIYNYIGYSYDGNQGNGNQGNLYLGSGQDSIDNNIGGYGGQGYGANGYNITLVSAINDTYPNYTIIES